jgi:hypothetical protein
MPFRILYAAPLGPGGTSLYRFHALERLKQTVIPFETEAYPAGSKIINALRSRLRAGPLVARINADLLAAIEREQPNVVWFDKPVHFTPSTIGRIRQTGAFTVCYNQDNPFGPRHDPGWYQLRRIHRLLDLHCLFRNADIPRYRQWKLNTIKIQLSYDPVAHFPPPSGWSDRDRTREVSYIGTPLEERPQFLRQLIEKHKLPVSISGPRWEKVLSAREFGRWVRGGMLLDAAYREEIWRSKINLAFVTRLNEEDVAHKAFEIAACQGFLLALRTPGHQACFEEGKEAEFFSSVEECAEKCRYYLEHAEERKEIARRGCERARISGYDNDTQLARVLERIGEYRPETPARRITTAFRAGRRDPESEELMATGNERSPDAAAANRPRNAGDES